MSTTATKPAVQSGKSSPLSASDAAQLAAWYARYALDRLGDDPRALHPGARSHLAAACLEPEAAAKAFGLEDDQLIKDGHGDGRALGSLLSVGVGVARNAEQSARTGGSKVLRCGPSDAVTLIGAGVTLHECLRAADHLALDGIHARVIDLYSIKPIDTDTLVAAADATGGRLVVAEDHHPEGGLGSAVAAALLEAGVQQLRLAHLSVSELPASGTPAELLAAAGIDAPHIASAAAALIDE